ncbi:MAG: Zn-ribbon domain-containing OB-fold protein [Sulfolobales archaeon]
MAIRDSPPRIWRLRDVLYRIKYAKCRSCGYAFYPPRISCIKCSSKDIDIMVSRGLGTLIEYTILYQVSSRFQDNAPLIIGLVRLDEGFNMYGQIVDIDPKDLRRGIRVEAVLRRLRIDGSSGLITYGLKFRPVIGVHLGRGS